MACPRVDAGGAFLRHRGASWPRPASQSDTCPSGHARRACLFPPRTPPPPGPRPGPRPAPAPPGPPRRACLFPPGTPSPRDRVFPQFTENTMPHPCNTGPDAAASQNPGDNDLESLLGDSDAHLVYEGLYRLRELKVEALRIVRAEGVRPNGRDFEPWDFGIPQIDRLLARFGADPVEGQ